VVYKSWVTIVYDGAECFWGVNFGTCFMILFWYLQFWGSSCIGGKIVDPCCAVCSLCFKFYESWYVEHLAYGSGVASLTAGCGWPVWYFW